MCAYLQKNLMCRLSDCVYALSCSGSISSLVCMLCMYMHVSVCVCFCMWLDLFRAHPKAQLRRKLRQYIAAPGLQFRSDAVGSASVGFHPSRSRKPAGRMPHSQLARTLTALRSQGTGEQSRAFLGWLGSIQAILNSF